MKKPCCIARFLHHGEPGFELHWMLPFGCWQCSVLLQLMHVGCSDPQYVVWPLGFRIWNSIMGCPFRLNFEFWC